MGAFSLELFKKYECSEKDPAVLSSVRTIFADLIYTSPFARGAWRYFIAFSRSASKPIDEYPLVRVTSCSDRWLALRRIPFNILLVRSNPLLIDASLYCPKPHDLWSAYYYFRAHPVCQIRGIEEPNSVRELVLDSAQKELLSKLQGATITVHVGGITHLRIHRKRLAADEKFIDQTLERFAQLGVVSAFRANPESETRVWELNQTRYHELLATYGCTA